MLEIWLYTTGSIILVSLTSLIGIFSLSFKKAFLKNFLLYLVSFAAGALLGDAFIHLLPESLENSSLNWSNYTLAGILIFFVLEKFLRWHHCHNTNCPNNKTPVAKMNLFGDALHNLIDGILIAASYSVNLELGLTTTIAILFHEIPQEIGDFAVLIHGGFSIKKALFFNFLSALTAIAGAIIFLTIGSIAKNISHQIISITAGGFIYIACSDLIPEIHQEVRIRNSFIQFISLLIGIGIMWAFSLLD